MGDNWVAAALDIGVMGKIKAGRWEPIDYFQKELETAGFTDGESGEVFDGDIWNVNKNIARFA